MIKGSTVRKPEADINALFADRWSPRAMDGTPVSDGELRVLFEAARWAPSSMNFQPWRFLYARRDSSHWPVYLDLLNEGNRVWAERAGAIVLFISRLQFDDGRPCITHAYDTGAAWQNFALQGYESGLAIHGIQGFDYDKARRVLGIPASFGIQAMAVVGHPADKAVLPEKLQVREAPNARRPVSDSAREGLFEF
jgi:nitroreductase